MKEYEFTISLRLRHPDIDPARITRTLDWDNRGKPRRAMISPKTCRAAGADP